MKILGWSAGFDGCEYYRLTMPLAELHRTGLAETAVVDDWQDRLMARGDGWRQPDVVVGQRVTNPGPSITWQKRTDVFRVYEMDDDLFNVDPSSVDAYQLFSRPDVQARIRENIRAADRVTVSTEHLGNVVQEQTGHGDIWILPNTIPEASIGAHSRVGGGPLVVGWGGSSTHAMDWVEAGPQVKRWLKRQTPGFAELHMIGHNYAADWDMPVRHTGWAKSVPEYWSALDFDIGLAPLRPHMFNRAKSYIKALEYAARGIPVIASDVGPYSGFVQHRETGLLVRQPHEWSRALTALTSNDGRLAIMSLNALKWARKFTIEQFAPLWLEALTPSPSVR